MNNDILMLFIIVLIYNKQPINNFSPAYQYEMWFISNFNGINTIFVVILKNVIEQSRNLSNTAYNEDCVEIFQKTEINSIRAWSYH